MATAEIDAARKFGLRVERVDPAVAESEIMDLRAEVRGLKMEIDRLTAERDSAEAGERSQRLRAERAERMNTGLGDQLTAANGQITTLMAELDQEKLGRHAAEAVSTERAITNERLLANQPAPPDMAPVIEAVKEMATKVQSTLPAQGPLPTFELHFQRGQNGLIKSPVKAIPVGG